MLKRRPSPLLWLLLAVIVSTSYTNCAKFETMSAGSATLDSSVIQTPPPGTGGNDGASVADSSGTIQAYQDRRFRFVIPTKLSAPTYSTAALPSWAAFDAATGAITGVPTRIETLAGMTITVTSGAAKETFGPYQIVVNGDPLKEHQWHLTNTGQKAFSATAGTAGQDINLVETIRDGILGEGVRIAISDTGVQQSHRGLSPNLLTGMSRNYNLNYSSATAWNGDSSPATADEGNAHGTAVAGIAVERGWQGFGGRGVAPFAKFAGFQFIPAQEKLSSSGYLTAALQDQYQGDFDIFNYSWGDPQCALEEYDAAYKQKIKNGITSLRGGKGAIYVKAAGNEFTGSLGDCYSSTTSYFLGNANFSEESTTPYMIVVGAVNAAGFSSSYSSPGSNIWISAPGGEYGWSKPSTADELSLQPAIVTTDFAGCGVGFKTVSPDHNDFDAGQSPNTNCEHTATMNGTSAATPVVSGAVALMLSANPNLTWRDVKHILAATADKVHPTAGATAHPASSANLSGHTYQQGWITNAAGYHFHNWYGFGRVNVDKAVAMAKNYVSNLGTLKETNSGTTWKYSGTVNASVPAASATGLSRTIAVSENYSIEAVQVRVAASSCIGNLGIELTSPSGTKSILMNINSYLLDSTLNYHVFLTNAFYGESSAGTWTMKLVGAKSGCTTTWGNWQLNVLGH